jgi:hypothetical protein
MRATVLDGVATPVASAGPEADAAAVVCLHGNPGYGAEPDPSTQAAEGAVVVPFLRRACGAA